MEGALWIVIAGLVVKVVSLSLRLQRLERRIDRS